MRALINVKPTAEQLALFAHTKAGAEIIRGAAGSGKTTTALLKLRTLIGFYVSRHARQNPPTPVKVLVLTYNTTLKGYIEELVSQQVAETDQIDIEIQTFSKWALHSLDTPTLITKENRLDVLKRLSKGIDLQFDFLEEEIDYLMGKFLPENLPDYLNVRRDGRGASPRVDKDLREQLLSNVVYPYIQYKEENALKDWNDLAIDLSNHKVHEYDIIVTDETQDFSANQIRAILNQVAKDHSLTFVLDTAQRIYARGFTWAEAGLTIRPEQSHRLNVNYRNTKQIAALSASLLNKLVIDDDATLPDFETSTRDGELPLILAGPFRSQMNYVLGSVLPKIDLSKESVAFLHPKGWFEYIKDALTTAKLPFVEITRKSYWPNGEENIALSTIHSAKGLEFDHVVILGLNAEVTKHGKEDGDDQLCMLRRLLAMGISRAKISVTLGYKPQDKSDLIDYIDPSTYKEINV